MTGWNDERLAAAERIWRAGHSAAQVAAAIGGGITRNAVVGMAHRKGWSANGRPPNPTPSRNDPSIPGYRRQARPQRKPYAPPATHAPTAQNAPAGSASELGAIPAATEAPPGPITLLDMPAYGRCRWPADGWENGGLEAPATLFCGEPTIDPADPTGCVYCLQHTLRAYQAGGPARRAYHFRDHQPRSTR